MIIRLWTFQVRAEDTARFEVFEKKEGIPMMLSQAGCLGVEMLRQFPESENNSGMVEYKLFSRWESWEQLQAGLNSTSWKEEVELFLSQSFGNDNGSVSHYEKL